MIALRGLTWQNPRGYDPLVAAARSWRLARPVSIEWEQAPWYSFEERVFGTESEHFDLVMFDHPWTGSLVRRRRLLPWDAILSQQYLRDLSTRVVTPSFESYTGDGHLWGLPVDASCTAGLYRDDLVDGQLPSTWEEVAAWARAHHHPPYRYGLVLSVQGALGNCLFLSMMASIGGTPYIDPEHPRCDRTTAEYVLTIVRDLLRFTPPASIEWGPWDIYDHITTEDDIAYCPSIFAYVNYFVEDGRGGHLRLSSVPSFGNGKPGRAILGGVGLGITSACKSVTEAGDFGKFLMDDETQRTLIPAHNGQPAVMSAWSDEELNQRTHGFYRLLAPNMSTAYIRPTYHGFHHLELSGGSILQRFWAGHATLSETLDALGAE